MKSIRLFTNGLIDYAGLFPPARLGMDEAVSNFASYLTWPQAYMLGRFVLPASRLEEFGSSAAGFLAQKPGKAGWRLAVLLSDDLESDLNSISRFNAAHSPGSVTADVVEVKADDRKIVEALHELLPAGIAAFVEMSPLADDGFFAALGTAGFAAKIRTGGIDPSAFPEAADIIGFMESCRRNGIAFKATAGLHHLVCNSYPLTYEPAAPRHEMFGYLNVFAAAVFLHSAVSADDAVSILREREPAEFIFSDAGLQWRNHFVSLQQIENARRHFAISFGSCSFTEPVEELAGLPAQITHS